MSCPDSLNLTEATVSEITTANFTARIKCVRDSRHNREDFGVIKETLQRRTHAQGATAPAVAVSRTRIRGFRLEVMREHCRRNGVHIKEEIRSEPAPHLVVDRGKRRRERRRRESVIPSPVLPR